MERSESKEEKFLRVLNLIGESSQTSLTAKVLYFCACPRLSYAFSNFLPDCWNSKDIADVANVFFLMIIYDPQKTNSPMLHAISPYVSDEKWMSYHSITPEFALGAVLGLFKAGNWILNSWQHQTDFFENLPDKLFKIITADNSLTPLINAELAKNNFESRLSPAIKEFFAGKSENRKKITVKLVHQLADKLNENLQYSALGEMLIRQIFIKHFISLDAWEQIFLYSRLNIAKQ